MVHHERVEGMPRTAIETAADDEARATADLSWEEEVLRRIAPHLAEVRRHVQDDAVLGWEAAGVRRLVQVTGGEY